MKKVFGVEKFKGLLLAGSFTVLANYFVRLSDSVVADNMLGPNALAGINLVSAILLAQFFRKSNTFAPVWHSSVRDSWRIVAASFGDAAAFLCDGLQPQCLRVRQ